MKIAVTGAKGMLAYALMPYLTGHELLKIDLPEIDITHPHPELLEQVLKDVDFVYHLAAYTDVDGAESDQDKAYLVNEKGTENLAKACSKLNIPLLYISTDYVFGDDSEKHAHLELDETSPKGVYANSKLAGEKTVQTFCKKHFIVRTAWLYGPNGKNFVKTMLKLAENKPEIKVVDNQIGSPTYTGHLAKALARFLDISEYGVYHLTNQGQVSWYGFACKIFELAGINVKLLPCATKDYPRPAPRPAYSVLANKHWQDIGQELMPSWEDGLKAYLKEIK